MRDAYEIQATARFAGSKKRFGQAGGWGSISSAVREAILPVFPIVKTGRLAPGGFNLPPGTMKARKGFDPLALSLVF